MSYECTHEKCIRDNCKICCYCNKQLEEIPHNKKTKYYIYTLKRELSELLKEGKIDEKTMRDLIDRLNDIEITYVSEIADFLIIQDCIKNIRFN